MKKVMNKISVLLIIFIGLLSSAYAVNYYVDYSAGNDNNAGTSTSAAFKHAPGDPTATGVAATKVLQAGDIVKFKGGVTYPNQIYVKWSGVSGQPIVYDGNLDNTWGIGKAIVDMNYVYNQAFTNTWDTARSYITVQGFSFINGRNEDSGSKGYMWLGAGSHNWIIRNNTFSHIQYWATLCPVGSSGDPISAPAISTRENTGKAYNLLIENNEFYAMGRTVISIRDGYNITIRNNDFGGINRGSETGWFSVAVRVELTTHDLLIQNNNFHDGWQYGGDDQSSELCHATDYVEMYGDSANAGPYNITVERNKFMMDHKFNYDHGTAYVIASIGVSYLTVRNNLFVNIPGNDIIMLANGAKFIYIYSNIMMMRVHNSVGSGGWYPVLDIEDSTPGPFYIMNNIFYSDLASNFAGGYLFYSKTNPLSLVMDYNLYYHAGGLAQPFFLYDGHGTRNFASWQSAGYDAHGKYGDPKFVYLPTDPAQTSLGDYRLQATSPAIDAGTVIAGYTDSLDGTIRPQGAGWDIGAYEYVSGGTYDPADTDLNGCISLGEMSVYVVLWLNNQITLPQVSSSIVVWLQQNCQG